MSVLVVLAGVMVLAVGLVGVVLVTYNRLVRKQDAVDNAWGQIDANLRRRYDLIETVKGSVRHQHHSFESVTAARSAAGQAAGPGDRAKAEDALTAALRAVVAVAVVDPRLQGSLNFAELQADLSDNENRIAYSRQYYNDAVLAYNRSVQAVPSNIVAGPTGFRSREFFGLR